MTKTPFKLAQLLIAVSMAIPASVALAQPLELIGNPVDSDEITQTRRATALIQLRAQEMAALAELRRYQRLSSVEAWKRHEAAKNQEEQPPGAGGVSASSPTPVASMVMGTPSASSKKDMAPAVPIEADLPRLVAVFGSGKNMYAAVRFRSGASADVRVGDELDTGHVVTSITPNRVVIKKDGQSVTLDTYFRARPEPAASRSSDGAGTAPGMTPAPIGPTMAPVPVPVAIPGAPEPFISEPPLPVDFAPPVQPPDIPDPNDTGKLSEGPGADFSPQGPQYDVPSLHQG